MPLRYGKFDIHDFHAQNRVLNVPEIFTYSSNIGAARIALASASKATRRSCSKLGQLDRLRTELPESAEPLVPKRWGELNTVTIAFGHGLSVAPLQAVMGDRRAGERRPADPADASQAQRTGSGGDRQASDQARNQ